IHGLRVILPAHRRSRRHGTAGWLQDRWFELGTGAFWRGVLHHHLAILVTGLFFLAFVALLWCGWKRSEEHTSELQSRFDLVCRLLLEKKKLKEKFVK